MDTEGMAHFWSSDRVLLALVFVIGLIVGGFVTNQYVDPYVNSAQNSDYNALVITNSRLAERNDQLFSCLQANSVDPDSCA